MNKKELKQLAELIVQQEKLLKKAANQKEEKVIEQKIMELCSRCHSLNDMITLDDIVQNLLLTL